jgi:hypothetical protein
MRSTSSPSSMVTSSTLRSAIAKTGASTLKAGQPTPESNETSSTTAVRVGTRQERAPGSSLW